jgi:general secretion pathway protein L
MLLLAQIVGLNAWAWVHQQQIAAKQAAQVALLKGEFPKVAAIADAPLQMQREIETLRAAAGRSGESDFEALLAATAAAWPDGQGAVPSLRFETGSLSFAAPGWTDGQIQALGQRLRPSGLRAEVSQGRVVVSRLPAGV